VDSCGSEYGIAAGCRERNTITGGELFDQVSDYQILKVLIYAEKYFVDKHYIFRKERFSEFKRRGFWRRP
jgi:hypothetical protein